MTHINKIVIALFGLLPLAFTATAQDDVFTAKQLMADNPNFTGDAWLNVYVSQADSMDCTVGSVTFAPGVRNKWHSHPGGQILICTSGEGRYQELGKAVQILHPGDVAKVAPNIVHWHGAASDQSFTHIAIGPSSTRAAHGGWKASLKRQPSKAKVLWHTSQPRDTPKAWLKK